MIARRISAQVRSAAAASAVSLALASSAGAYTLWSTAESYLGSGELHGPGVNMENGPLFATVIRNMMFTSKTDLITPFINNGPQEPNICSEKGSGLPADGKLPDGTLINENVDTCAAMIGNVRVLTAAIAGGHYQGEQASITLQNGDVIMGMDFSLDFGTGEAGVVRLPFYGTTGEIVIPYSLQTQMGERGVDQAGKYASGTRLRGRIGDFNKDGWIDGTILAAGTLPLTSRLYPGQPYLIVRHFETDIPIEGVHSGDVRALTAGRHNAPGVVSVAGRERDRAAASPSPPPTYQGAHR